MRRALLVLPILLLAAFLLWPSAGSADDLPEAPLMEANLSVAYYQDAYVRGGGINGATIEVVLTSTGELVPCMNRSSSYEDGYPLVPGPIFVESGGFRCSLPGKDFHNPTKTESTTSITVYQVVNGVRSHGKVVNVTFRASRFSLEVEPPESLPIDEPIMFTGIREDGAGFIPIRIDWTIKRNGVSVFPERDTDKRSCDAGDQADVDTFTCYFDSDNPGDMVPPDPVEPMLFTPVTPAFFVAPAIQVSPAILPDGNYAVTLNEVVGDDVADSINFNFTVGNVNSPPPNAPPGETDELAGPTFETIPLAPIPTPDPEIDDAPDEAPVAAPPTSPVDRDVLRILILAIIAFTVMAMSGARGLGSPRRLIESPVAAGPPPQDGEPLARDATMAVLAGLGGEVLDGSDEDAGRARPFGNAWGDRSVTWRFPGWPGLDRLSRAVPVTLAPRLPLVARITADASYLRATLGVLWTLLPLVGLVLGTVAASAGGAAPLPPALGLVAGLLVLAVLDASAGAAAVAAFTAVTLARGGLTAEGLSLGEGVRGLMGLAALWFIAPLVAAAARPLRRVAEPEHVYSWDRFGDTVIAALISGWAVQGIVGALGDLTGRELAITSDADGLALLTIAAVVGRFLLEEAVASLYPRRLHAVQERDTLPDPTQPQQVRGLLFRAGLLAFFAGAFLGNCWQLWAGVVIFSIPQVMQLMGTRIPDFRKLVAAVPRGVVRIFVLVAVGTAIAYLVDSRGSDDELTAIRQGFVLLAIPGAALEILSVFGGETPKVHWTWPKQLAGAGVVAVTAVLVLFLL